jgi:hypothetical protein
VLGSFFVEPPALGVFTDFIFLLPFLEHFMDLLLFPFDPFEPLPQLEPDGAETGAPAGAETVGVEPVGKGAEIGDDPVGAGAETGVDPVGAGAKIGTVGGTGDEAIGEPAGAVTGAATGALTGTAAGALMGTATGALMGAGTGAAAAPVMAMVKPE